VVQVQFGDEGRAVVLGIEGNAQAYLCMQQQHKREDHVRACQRDSAEQFAERQVPSPELMSDAILREK
jgi:hypothetical protein